MRHRQGRTREGAENPGPPPMSVPPEGGTLGGGFFNITSACIFLPQAIYILHCIAMHCTHLVIE